MAIDKKQFCNVNAQLHSLLVPVTELHLDPKNARDHSERNHKSIAESYKTFGQQKPIVCTKLGKAIAGNGQLAAAIELGWTHIACIKFDSEDEARQLAFALADNKTAELASWNFPVLAESLSSLQNDQALLDATGFAEFEIEPLVSAEWSPPSLEGDADASGAENTTNAVKFSPEQWGEWIALREQLQIHESMGDADAMAEIFRDRLSE